MALSLFRRRSVDIRAMRATRAIAGRVSSGIRREGRWAPRAVDIPDERFVPALFGAWAVRVADAAGLGPGDHVLDVACGTGALSAEAARRVEPGGAVTGLDCNNGRLAAAKRQWGNIEWRLGKPESLPFEARGFDAAVSQFGLTFFADRVWALHEMWRVLRPGGRLAVAVWDRIAANAGYEALATLVEDLFGNRIAGELRAPFALGDRETLRTGFAAAGIGQVEIGTAKETARFRSLMSWIEIETREWTLAGLIDDEQSKTLLAQVPRALRKFVRADGSVAFQSSAHIVTAAKM